MKVRFSRPAEADLEAIGDHIALDDPASADRFIGELREAALSLCEYPRRFPLIEHGGRREIRKLVRGNYLIFYRIASAEVEVVRVAHGATDWVRLFDK